MASKDTEYYRRRAATERAYARAASQPEIAAIHEQMAQMYERVLDLETRQRGDDDAAALSMPIGEPAQQ